MERNYLVMQGTSITPAWKRTVGGRMPHLGRLGLHDQLNAVDVQAARGHVGGHQDVEARLPETPSAWPAGVHPCQCLRHQCLLQIQCLSLL